MTFTPRVSEPFRYSLRFFCCLTSFYVYPASVLQFCIQYFCRIFRLARACSRCLGFVPYIVSMTKEIISINDLLMHIVVSIVLSLGCVGVMLMCHVITRGTYQVVTCFFRYSR